MNNKLTDETLSAWKMEAKISLGETAKGAWDYSHHEAILALVTELQERRKADSDGMSAGNYCYHYKAEGENGCYAGVANVSDQVVDWNTFQAFKITAGRLNGDKITGITSLSFLGEVNKS
ncbi:hypothetical protein D6R85_03080 [Salmonella enterica subsp. enterica serovar Telelkebir]|nr:hypothetical protein [Salmonella enterica subsp. enterica serovar Telelkebir]